MTSEARRDQCVYVDTGASSHMTNNACTLINLIPYSGSDKVTNSDGAQLHISHGGYCMKYQNFKLNSVLVVPKIKKNLISVSQLAKDNACICEFSDSGFVIKDREMGKILATSSRQGNLYALKKEANATLVVVTFGKAPEDIWHQHLGHPTMQSIKFLAAQNLIEINKWTKDNTICSNCQIGKSC